MNLLWLAVILIYLNYANNDLPITSKMMVKEDILAELATELVTKVIGEPGQGDINILS